MKSVKLPPLSMAENRLWTVKCKKQQTGRAFGQRRPRKPPSSSVLGA